MPRPSLSLCLLPHHLAQSASGARICLFPCQLHVLCVEFTRFYAHTPHLQLHLHLSAICTVWQSQLNKPTNNTLSFDAQLLDGRKLEKGSENNFCPWTCEQQHTQSETLSISTASKLLLFSCPPDVRRGVEEIAPSQENSRRVWSEREANLTRGIYCSDISLSLPSVL